MTGPSPVPAPPPPPGAARKPPRLPPSWRETLAAFTAPPVARMLLLGFSAGLPLLLVFGTLSVWLREAGVDLATVTLLSWTALAYSFKFLWAPLIDQGRVPLLTAWLGRRRGWLLLSQGAVIAALLWTAAFDPAHALAWTVAGAVMLAFASATQDIVIDAYRIEAAEPALQSMMSAMYIAGYRIGMLVSGAGSLWLAAALETGTTYDPQAWAWVYRAMAAVMAVGVLATLSAPEPAPRAEANSGPAPVPGTLAEQGRLLGVIVLAAGAFLATFLGVAPLSARGAGALTALGCEPLLAAGLAEASRLVVSVLAAAGAAGALVLLGLASRRHVRETYLAPLADFLARQGRMAAVVLALIATYRLSDTVMGAVATVFYVDMGFTKAEIATYTKAWGLAATLAGGFLGGVGALRLGVMPVLFLGAVLSAASNLLFAALAARPGDTVFLLGTIVADNLSGGLAGAAFVAYLSALTSVRFTAMQYALFSSLMTLLPKGLAGYGGAVVEAVGYGPFFIGTAVLGVPVLALVAWAGRVGGPGLDRRP
ncbi:AmpG family muropeptide MFS transporter [Pararhodospirillum oryzae]|uniref:MFS transporter n=1 Tax=Pararhodospirillum oryzae TaxID=478448 RepID=A0A512H8X2_9PROT|nr:MFS transporter [Pararhodospirillum oryzae]GEO81891.1 MFS transporter [Pararhodospirillum oryzae]